MTRRDFIVGGLSAVAAGECLSSPVRSALGAERNNVKAPLPYDAEVEYLESTGTQWIDTGYAPATDVVTVSAKYEFTANYNGATVWGANLPTDRNWMANQYSNSWWFGVTSGQFSSSQGAFLHDVSWNINNGTVSGHVNSTSYSGTYSGSVVSGYSVYLFGCNSGGSAQRVGYSQLKLYSFTLSDNGVLVRDMIPVRFTNEQNQSEGAMYDRVSGALFRNAGTGSFVIGPEV